MKKYIIVTVSDGYDSPICKKSIINNKQIEKIRPLIKAIKNKDNKTLDDISIHVYNLFHRFKPLLDGKWNVASIEILNVESEEKLL